MKKSMIVAVAALIALSVSASAFAADQIRLNTGTKIQIKSGTCVK
jgi:hypothetical protein